MKQLVLFAVFLFVLSANLYAQHNFSCFVKDDETKEILQSVTAKIEAANKATTSDSNGRIAFKNLAAGSIKIIFSFVGYQDIEKLFPIPQGDTVYVIYLEKKVATEDAVIINSSRTNSRIEDLPTKVEVLGSEEVDEEASTIPGNIATNLSKHRQY
jgi:homoaconitase/3-isopropylmalate dehydratase large subunit